MAQTIKIITAYDYEAIAKPTVDFPKNDPKSRSITNQSDAKETDINTILKRYEKTGYIPDQLTGEMRKPIYGDFTVVSNYYELKCKLARVEQAFDAYPAELRARFKNDPQELINFLSDSKNDREAVELGLKDESVLPTTPVWNTETKKWISPRDGKVLDVQKPAPTEQVQPANPAA